MRLAKTSLVFDHIKAKLPKLVETLFSLIPSGVGSEGAIPKLTQSEEKRLLRDGARWAVAQGYGREEDLWFTEEGGRLATADAELVSEAVREAVADQSFAALRELAEDDRALTVALEQAALLWPIASELASAPPELARRLGAWLARAARVLDQAEREELGELSSSVALPEALPRTRVGLLERAVELRPEDHELANPPDRP